MSAPASAPAGRVYLVRHGETAWSLTGQHTSVTDLPLTPHGEEQAESLRTALAGIDFERVLVSPRRRARRTAELAGFADRAEVDEDLAEWDYGGYEGLTSAEIAAANGGEWDLWRDGVVAGATPGEDMGAIVRRTRSVASRARRTTARGGNVLLFAHGHILRALAVTWIDLPVVDGRKLGLDTATVSVLGYENGHAAILRWNAPAQ